MSKSKNVQSLVLMKKIFKRIFDKKSKRTKGLVFSKDIY